MMLTHKSFGRTLVGLIALGLVSLFALQSCSRSRDYASFAESASMETASASGGVRMKMAAPASPSAQEVAPNGASSGDAAYPVERKLVKRADFTVQVKELEQAEATVRARVEALNGYVSSANSNEGQTWLELRVPHASFDALVEELAPLGKVLNRSVTSEDVTLRYYDLESRLENKRQLMETFRQYLRKAQRMEDILTVETRLSELQNEIDGLGSEFKALANLVDYATISLNLRLPEAAVVDSGPGLGERLVNLLGDFGDFLEGFVTVLVGIVVYGIPILAALAAAWWLLFGRVGLLLKLFKVLSGKK